LENIIKAISINFKPFYITDIDNISRLQF